MMSERANTVFLRVLQTLCFSLGISAIGWGCYTFPISWGQSGVSQVASHVIAGDPYKAKALNAVAPKLDATQLDKWSHPSATRDGAVIELRRLETALSDGSQKDADALMPVVHDAIQQSLASAPADPFLWAVLYWVENIANGYNPEHFKFLRMSYAVGPNEGWIAINRNRIALAVFPQLPPDLAELAKTEFVRLVDSRLYNEAANILIGPGWKIRGILLPALKDASELNRQLFARVVYRMGYDISVPGVEKRDQRPWD